MKENISPQVNSGVALGGLGTGTIELRPDGRFYNWQIFNNPPWTPEAPAPKSQDNTRVGGTAETKAEPADERSLSFLLWAKAEDERDPRMFLLALDNDPLNTNRFYIPYLRTPGSIEYSGEFPVAMLRYTDLGIPLKVIAEFLTPFIPGREEESATPGFYATFTVEPEDSRKWDVSITAILTNAVGWDQPNTRKNNEVLREGRTSIIRMNSLDAEPGAASTGTMALGARGRGVSYQAGYRFTTQHRGTADRRYLFTDLYNDGKLPDWPHGLETPSFPRRLRRGELSVEEAERFEEACRKHYDIAQYQRYRSHLGTGPEGIDRLHKIDKKAYDERADLLSRQDDPLRRWEGALCLKGQTREGSTFSAEYTVAWHFPNHLGFRSKDCKSRRVVNMGHEYASRFDDAADVVRTLFKRRRKICGDTRRFHDAMYSMRLDTKLIDQVSAQLSTLVRCSWWTADRKFAIWEGLGCCGMHTTDVAYYGSIPISLLFPLVATDQLELTRRNQHSNGRVPHLFQSTLSDPDDQWYRTDMMAQFVLMAYRDWRWHGDDDFLERFYPNCVRAMKAMAETDTDGNGLPDAKGTDTTYDTWGMFGTTTFMSGLFLAGLKALEAMALRVGDRNTVEFCRNYFSRGRKSFNEELWNGSYFRLWHMPENGQTDEGCMADQFAGYWYCAMLGLEPYADRKKVKKALRSIMHHNFVPGRGLVNGSYPAGTEAPLQYYINYMVSEVWSGIEYAVASLMLYEGMKGDAAAICDEVYRRYHTRGGIWRHDECGTYYYRPMSVWSVIMGLQQFRLDAPLKSLELRTAERNHRTVLCTGNGWGEFIRSQGPEAAIRWQDGSLKLKRLTLHTGNRARRIRVKLNGKSLKNCTSERSGSLTTVIFQRQLSLKKADELRIYAS